MAAVAARTEITRREAVTRRAGVIKSVRVRRRKKSHLTPKTVGMLSALLLTLLLCYINVYANLTTAGYNRSKLDDLCRQERIENQRLKVELTKLSSPHNVVLAAQKAGMVYATEYDYLPKSENVASAVSPSTSDN